MNNKKQIITGYASLKGTGGKSITDDGYIPTTGNINVLTPDDDLVSKAMGELQQAGFHCDYQSPVISLKGSASLFEEFFMMEIDLSQHSEGFYAVARTKAIIPSFLKDIVSDIVFSEPVELF